MIAAATRMDERTSGVGGVGLPKGGGGLRRQLTLKSGKLPDRTMSLRRAVFDFE
jgi:hypothetical protein